MEAQSQSVHNFSSGFWDGNPWGLTQKNVPRLLQNCYIERGAVRTRQGHTLVATSSGTPILAHTYKPAIHYAAILEDNATKYGYFSDSTTFVAKNIYSTGTIAVSAATATLTGAVDMRSRLPACASHKIRYKVSGTYCAWTSISSVNSASELTLASSPGNETGVAYQIAIGGANTAYGNATIVGDRYVVFCTGGAPFIYDITLGYGWSGGIPTPSAPTGSFAAGGAYDAGWYGYAVVAYDTDGNKGDSISARMVKQSAGDNTNIDINFSTSGFFSPWRTIGAIEVYRTVAQVSEAAAGTATLYLLTKVNTLSFQDFTTNDNARDANVDTGTAWSAGSTFLGTLHAPTSGGFREADGDTGWFGYAITTRLWSGEEGPISERLVIEKATESNTITLTFPALLDYSNGYYLYRTTLQDTQAEAEKAELYWLFAFTGITGTDSGDDETLLLGITSPTETVPFGVTTGADGVANIDATLYAYGGDNYVRKSGLVDADIANDRGTGLDEPNYWPEQYQTGQSSDECKVIVDYSNNVYSLTPSGTYMLDRSQASADLWYFTLVTKGAGCSFVNGAVGGLMGIYSAQTGTDGVTRIFRITNGSVEQLNEIQGSMDNVTTVYCTAYMGGKIYFSTEDGLIVHDERLGTFAIHTGLTIRCFSESVGILYGADATGKVYSLFSKAKGTAGDEGAYTWVYRSGAFRADTIHPAGYPEQWVRFENDAASAATVTTKVSVNGYTSFVQDGVSDWSGTFTVTASDKDYIGNDKLTPSIDNATTVGIQFSGTGGYGKLALVSHGVLTTTPDGYTIG